MATTLAARPFERRTLAVFAALAALTALAWVDLAWMAADPAGMASPGTWTWGYGLAMFAMWAVMMAAMMVPSAAPAIFLFAALRRHAGRPADLAVALFTLGYVLAWTAFSVAATLAQWALATGGLLGEAMASADARLVGLLFVAAGLYQFSASKAACLAQCREPTRFIVERRRDGPLGPLAMGLEHGTYCIGCCGALMALLFAFGVMNLAWVLALSAFVVAEKLFPAGRAIARAGGIAMIAIGIIFFLV